MLLSLWLSLSLLRAAAHPASQSIVLAGAEGIAAGQYPALKMYFGAKPAGTEALEHVPRAVAGTFLGGGGGGRAGVNTVTAAQIAAAALQQLAVPAAAGGHSRGPLEPALAELTGPGALEAHCSERDGTLCVLVGLPHILDCGRAGRLEALQVLADVERAFRADPAAAGFDKLNFVWFEGGAQPKLEAAARLQFGWPAVAVVHRRKRLCAVQPLPTAWDAAGAAGLEGFLHRVLAGKEKLAPLGGLLDVAAVAPWDGQDGQLEEEMSLADIMGDDGDL